MQKIAIAGSEDFVLGFKLAGIRDTYELNSNPMITLRKLLESEFGIVVVEERFLELLKSEDRVDIEDNVKPVFISLSTKESQESLMRMIKKSIGIELWKE
ncbi:MAG: V-type ATP synthase subunit F [Nanoarchaeota archaeon]